MPESDITKMKVADLKRELKIRGLSTTGNKNELQDRLQNALIDGDDVLEDSCNISCEDELLGDADLTDDEEAKILGEDESDEILTTSTSKSPIGGTVSSPLKLNTNTGNTNLLEDELLKSPNAESPASANAPKKIVLKRKISAPSSSDSSNSNGQTKENNPGQQQSSGPKVIKIDDDEDGSKQQEESLVSKNKLAHMSQQERLEMRRKKFGVNTTTTTTTAAAVTTTQDNPKKTLGKIVNDLPDDPNQLEKLKKRAERFGCAVAPAIASIEAKEKLEQRKQRFGISAATTSTNASTITTTTNTTTTTATGNAPSDAWAEKARMRLERFSKGAAVTADAPTAVTK